MSDKQDIVEQLRSWSEQLKSLSRWTSGKLKFPQRITLIGEAADEIEKLRKERDEARRECRLLLLGQEVLRGVRDLPAPPDDLVTIVPVPRKEDGK